MGDPGNKNSRSKILSPRQPTGGGGPRCQNKVRIHTKVILVYFRPVNSSCLVANLQNLITVGRNITS